MGFKAWFYKGVNVGISYDFYMKKLSKFPFTQR